MKQNNVRIGLLGLGQMGQHHLRNLAMIKQVELVFIYDQDEQLRQQMADHYNLRASVNIENDLSNVDAVIIVTPTDTHFDYIQKASEYVKYIFVEKPLTETSGTTLKVVKLMQEKDLKIQVGFIERYNTALVALNKVLMNSNRVINIDFSRTNKVSSRITDVDVIIDLMVHDIDLALLLNGKPRLVKAHGYIKNNIIEYARAIITHENGRFSNLVASRITEKKIRSISATCDDMYIDCNLTNKQVFVNKQTTQQYLDSVSISSKEETIFVAPQEALLLELIDFIKLCSGQAVSVPDVNDALNAIMVAEKIKKEIMEGSSTYESAN